MYCSNYGTQNAAQAIRCDRCGTHFASAVLRAGAVQIAQSGVIKGFFVLWAAWFTMPFRTLRITGQQLRGIGGGGHIHPDLAHPGLADPGPVHPDPGRPRALRPALAAGVLLACAVTLAGCSGEPSEKDIRIAVENSMSGANDNPFAQMASQAMGSESSRMVEIHELQKLGCRKQDDAFHCDVSMEASVFGMRQKGETRVRMLRGKDGWIAMDH